jgi:hypothetical protein
MLDYRLVELALRIPEKLLFAPGEPKPLLRKAVSGWLPESVTQRRDKRGFPTPLHAWQERTELRELVLDLTTPGRDLSNGGWRVPLSGSDGVRVFSDPYLNRRDQFEPSELWTVLSVNGWLTRLAADSFSQPHRAAA